MALSERMRQEQALRLRQSLKPEAVEVLRQLVDHSRELSKALAKIVNQSSREFKEHPGGEYIDRQQAMGHVLAIRDAHYRLAEAARQAIVALGVPERHAALLRAARTALETPGFIRGREALQAAVDAFGVPRLDESKENNRG